MAGHSRSKNGVASLAYVPAIHDFVGHIGKGHSTEVDPKPHPLSLDQYGQLQIGMAGQREGHLLVAEKAFHRMIECPLATFPSEHHALTPVLLERFTSLVQVIDETVNGRVVQVRAYVGAKLRHDASGAVGIIVDKRARTWFEKDEMQEVPVTRSV